MSTFVDPYTRLSLIAGTSTSAFQIPNSPGQPVGLNGGVTSAFGVTTFNSAMLNENQFEDTQYGVLALQRSINGFDGQVSYFTRYDRLHYSPDPLGDLLINGVASDVGQGRRVRSGAQQSLHHHRHDRRRHHPRHDQRASRRRQHAGRENPVAVPRRLAGFRRQRPPSCPQRSRQSAISHQRRDAARRPDRLRQHSRRQLDRQYRPWSSARCRPNMACGLSAWSTSRPAPIFSITAVKSAFTAAVKERSRRRFNTAARSAAPVRR